ncbi:MAG: rane protein of unknown function [Candidatus Saccharibacteria bacterium]|nr:rane protein of unknown function [Candidatus Saccharibacteria bacterium]
MKLNINRVIKTVVLALVFTAVIPFAAANAAPAGTGTTTTTSTSTGTACSTDASIFPRWYDTLCENGNIKSPNEIGGGGNDTASTEKGLGGFITIIALNIVQMLLFVVGYVSIGFVIYGGFKYMTQGDNSSGTVAARKTIQNAIIGLVLSILSVAIIKFVAGAVDGSSTGGGGSGTTQQAASPGTVTQGTP